MITVALFTGCAYSPSDKTAKKDLYLAPQTTFYSPAFLIKEPEYGYNRIGTPSVRKSSDQEIEIFVDSKKPAIFFETQEFTTLKGTYQNLIYRIHFEQVPFSLDKFNITAGKNPGLLIIYTLDKNGQLLLVTTVHTCGCYLAFFPTQALPKDLLPENWPNDSQRVYGYSLPSQLQLSQNQGSERIVFTIESETHRISNVVVSKKDILQDAYDTVDMHFFAMNQLYQLPYNDTTESFFEMDGPRKGYVRNNLKILERVLISWWAFDLHVGEDKAFGAADTSGVIFYTSLKFWDRKASDLKDFPGFLSYWGWNL
jgi:hypothetical protein